MNIEITKRELEKTFNLLRFVVQYKPDFERVTYSLCAAYSKTLAAALGINGSLVSWTVVAGRSIEFYRFDRSDSGELIETL